jgi:NodT family efflux transporter outer membrane factor (OMF) lipoprotein
MNRFVKPSLLTLSLLLSACAVGPDYQRPTVTTPATYKEADGWKVSEPKAVDADATWWAIFNDPVLDDLEKQVEVSNQTIAQSEAAWRGALAAADQAQAALFPTVSANGSFTREKVNASSFGGTSAGRASAIGNTYTAGGSLSWEIDVWGKLRRTLEAAQATADADKDALAAATLTEQAALASDYFQLRGADELKRLLDATVVAYERSLKITQNQYKAGTAAKSDVDQALTQLETTRSQAIATVTTRAQLEHAIAVLLGKAPAEFSIAPTAGLAQAPGTPVAIPSALLERRPDIAEAEKQMASANANIGVAIAAYYPDLTFDASFSRTADTFSKLLRAGSNVWSFGPSLSETVLDWGARDAQVAQARASYDGQVAAYRQTVLTAFQQVEDDLINLTQLTKQAEVEHRAVASADEAERLITNQYRAGTVAYTSVVTAQAASLSAKQSELTIHQNQLTTTVGLLQAMGGGWKAPVLTSSSASP